MAASYARERSVHGGTVRVTLPLSVACDLDKFQRALANLAVRTNCRITTPQPKLSLA